MKKKKITIILSVILIIVSIALCFGIDWLFSEQYNKKGISHFLIITVDKDQSKEYIGDLDGYKIYMENLDLEETYFRTINAENISIKETLEKKLVSIDEWKKYAWNIKKENDAEILEFENYEIAIINDECIIRPLSRQ